MNVADLKVGQKLVINSGAYYPTYEAIVRDTGENKWGAWAEIKFISGEMKGTTTRISGTSTERGIGWSLPR